MPQYTVDGKRINRPSDYDAFDYKNKNCMARTSQVGKSGEEKDVDIGFFVKRSLSELYEKVRNYKEKDIPLKDVLIIPAENNREEKDSKKAEDRDEGMTH